MRWEKLGLIFNVSGESSLMKSHAQLPVVLPLGNGRIRVFFSSRDEFNQSRPFYFEGVCENDSFKVTYVHHEPLIDLGSKGTFDDSGIMFSSWIKLDEVIYMYYIGWSLKKNVPYELSIGVAKSFDGINFEKLYQGPILTKNIYDHVSASRPIVIHFGEKFYMFYLSSSAWLVNNGTQEIHYDVKVRVSDDPFTWTSRPWSAIESKSEKCFSPSCILQMNSNYYLFICGRDTFDFRNNTQRAYRIYYCESNDLINWSEPELVKGLEPSGYGFDSMMAEYFYCFEIEGQWYGLYNGDQFGKTGIGLAKLVEI